MKTIYIYCSMFLLVSCGAKRTVVSHNSNLIELDTNVDYVQQYFNKNQWPFPVFIDTADSVFKINFSLPAINNNRYNTALNAFEQLKPNLEVNNKTAYILTHTKVYKKSNKIYYSIGVTKDRDNYLRGNEGCEECTFIDSNRILERIGRALFIYQQNKLVFLRWDD